MGMAGREYPALICAKRCFTDHRSGISDMYPSRSQPSQRGAFRSTDKAWRRLLRPPDRAAHPMTDGSSSSLLPCVHPHSPPSSCSNDTGLLRFLQYAKPTPTRPHLLSGCKPLSSPNMYIALRAHLVSLISLITQTS